MCLDCQDEVLKEELWKVIGNAEEALSARQKARIGGPRVGSATNLKHLNRIDSA